LHNLHAISRLLTNDITIIPPSEPKCKRFI